VRARSESRNSEKGPYGPLFNFSAQRVPRGIFWAPDASIGSQKVLIYLVFFGRSAEI
jgi:hypothetical protein